MPQAFTVVHPYQPSMFTFVKEFLSAHDVDLKSQDLKRIRFKLPKGNARTIEKELDTEAIRSILQHMDARGGALVLVLASSGMRVGEALQVDLNDIDLNAKPASARTLLFSYSTSMSPG